MSRLVHAPIWLFITTSLVVYLGMAQMQRVQANLIELANVSRCLNLSTITPTARVSLDRDGYPWSSTVPELDLALGKAYLLRSSPAQAVEHLRQVPRTRLRLFDRWTLARALIASEDWRNGVEEYGRLLDDLPAGIPLHWATLRAASELAAAAYGALEADDLLVAQSGFKRVLRAVPGHLIASYGALLVNERLHSGGLDPALLGALHHYRFNPAYDSSTMLASVADGLTQRGIWTERDAALLRSSLAWVSESQSSLDCRSGPCFQCGTSRAERDQANHIVSASRDSQLIARDMQRLVPGCSTDKSITLGGNLLMDGGFEQSESARYVGWFWYSHERSAFGSPLYGDGFFLAGLDRSEALSGRQSGRIIGFWVDQDPSVAQADASIFHGPVKLEPGRTYFYSFAYKTANLGDRSHVGTNPPTGYLRLPPTDGEWWRVAGLFSTSVAPASQAYIGLQLSGSGQAWIDEAELVLVPEDSCFARVREPLAITFPILR